MQYRRLGTSGLELSAVALGCWATVGDSVDDRGVLDLLEQARADGVTVLDTAETYGDGRAEQALGRALEALAWPRETYVVCAKVFYGTHRRAPGSHGLSRKHVVEGAHATLRRLGLEHLDLLLCHRHDPHTPLVETVRAMSDLVTQGKILYWGVSEWPVDAVRHAHDLAREHGWHPPVTEQLEYNMLARDRVEHEFAGLADDLGLGLMTWSPLAYGLLAGRYDDGFSPHARLAREGFGWLREHALGPEEQREDVLDRIRGLNQAARDAGVEPSQAALAWVLRHPLVSSAITGASRPEQLRQTLGAVELLERGFGDHVDDLLGDRAPTLVPSGGGN